MGKKETKTQQEGLPVFSWGHNRRINLASNHTRMNFGSRLQKLTLDAGFTCPNRDGKVSVGGCSFCNNNAFNPSYCRDQESISLQLERGIRFHRKRYRKASLFLAYFQAYSNTYAPVDVLRKKYMEALAYPDVMGLVIGTRPDCVDEQIFDLLAEINKNYYLMVEFGIESVYNQSLEKINRGHSFEKSVWAVQEAARRGVQTGGHLIFGLPGESRSMMLDSAEIISNLPLNTIKFHQLQIVKGTRMAQDFEENPEAFTLFTLDEYVDFICEYLGRLRPSLVIERLAGEANPDYNLTNRWNLRYDKVLSLIEKRLEETDCWQGKFFINT